MKQRHFFSEHRILDFDPTPGAISHVRKCPAFALFTILLFTFLLNPIAAGAADITQQLHRPLNSSSWATIKR